MLACLVSLGVRLDTISFKFQFAELCNDITRRLGVLRAGITSLKTSGALKAVLEHLLAIGTAWGVYVVCARAF